jgi:hypothetical protein
MICITLPVFKLCALKDMFFLEMVRPVKGGKEVCVGRGVVGIHIENFRGVEDERYQT